MAAPLPLYDPDRTGTLLTPLDTVPARKPRTALDSGPGHVGKSRGTHGGLTLAPRCGAAHVTHTPCGHSRFPAMWSTSFAVTSGETGWALVALPML
jgi:hypothetical protein